MLGWISNSFRGCPRAQDPQDPVAARAAVLGVFFPLCVRGLRGLCQWQGDLCEGMRVGTCVLSWLRDVLIPLGIVMSGSRSRCPKASRGGAERFQRCPQGQDKLKAEKEKVGLLLAWSRAGLSQGFKVTSRAGAVSVVGEHCSEGAEADAAVQVGHEA